LMDPGQSSIWHQFTRTINAKELDEHWLWKLPSVFDAVGQALLW
jgi:hypothetical protein